MPEWTTPLLRVLVAMPSLGICSRRKTSSECAASSQASAQPTTPPPMMTTFARSMGFRCPSVKDSRDAPEGKPRRGSGVPQRQEVLRALHRLLETLQELLQVRVAPDEIDFRGIDDEQIGGRVAEEKVFVGARHFFNVFERDAGFAGRRLLGHPLTEHLGRGLQVDHQFGRPYFCGEA